MHAPTTQLRGLAHASTRVLALALTVAGSAAGADPGAARSHVDRATELHAAGRHAEALAELGTAYTLEPRPELLYAMAQLHVKLDDCAQAIPLYERFLASRPGPAPHADATEAIARCRARHVERATRLHAEQRFADALAALTRAYVEDPQPALLYAIAQVHVKLGDCGRATLYYERYLATKPKERSQAAAREAIEACRELPPPRAPETAPQVLVARVAPPLRAPRAWYRDRWGGALAAGGTGLAIAGLATYGAARGNLVAATTATDLDRHDDLARRGRRQRAAAIGLGAGALALAGAAITRYVLASRTEQLTIAPPTDSGTGAAAVFAWGRTF